MTDGEANGVSLDWAACSLLNQTGLKLHDIINGNTMERACNLTQAFAQKNTQPISVQQVTISGLGSNKKNEKDHCATTMSGMMRDDRAALQT